MELSKSICANLQKIYPTDTYVAYSPYLSVHGHYDHVCLSNQQSTPRVMRLRSSSAESMNNSVLESLLHKMVFDSRSVTDNTKRAIHIYDRIVKMLPGTNPTIFVTPSDKKNKPQIFGPIKGVAHYWEPEFGSHVSVLLH